MAICVGCGLEVESGILRVQLQSPSGMNCNVNTGLAVQRSPDAQNGIQVRGNGLFAQCPRVEASIRNDTSPQGVPVAISTAGAGTFHWDSPNIVITNTTLCEVRGVVTFVTAIGGNLASGADILTRLQLNTNSGGFIPANQGDVRVHHLAAGTLNFRHHLADSVFLSLGPGASVNYIVQVRVAVVAGTGNITDPVSFETQWTLPQACC